MHKNRVLILGLGANGLGILRALHRIRDLDLLAVNLGTSEIGRVSSLGQKVQWPQAVDDADALLARLLEWCGDGIPTVLFPTRDIEVNLLAELSDRLPDHFLFYRNSITVVKALSDKNLVRDTATQAGLEIPKTLYFADSEALDSSDLRFPVLIKPLRQNMSQTPFKNMIVNSQQELAHTLRENENLRGHVILQEFIPGGDDHVYHCNLLIDAKGQTLGMVELQKIRQYLPLRGMTSYGRTLLTRDLLPLSERLASAAGYAGLMNVEFKKDAENGRWVFIEVNLRLPIFNSVFPASGINLADLYVRSLIETVSGPVYATTTATWMHDENDLANILTRKVETRLFEWFRQFIRTDSFAYWSARDPLPGLYAWSRNILIGLKKLAGGLRALLNPASTDKA